MVDSEPSEANGNVKSNGPPHSNGHSQPQNGLSPQKPLEGPLKCPECGSNRIWKDGYRYTDKGPVQRFLCRFCGYRFSDFKVKFNVGSQILEKPDAGKYLSNPHIGCGNLVVQPSSNDSPFKLGEDVGSHGTSEVSITEKCLNTLRVYNRNCRVCVSEVEAKNSAPKAGRKMENVSQAGKWGAGATETAKAKPDIKGKIVEFLWWMKKQGYAESTITGRVKALEILCRRGANLLDPESVKEVMARQNWSEGRKATIVKAYNCFLRMVGGSWNPPIIREVEKLPFIPTEQELDCLIAATRGKLCVFLQLLKETGMRAGEAWALKWTDIDFENGTVRVTPEKGSKARCFKLSARLMAMLNRMEKKSEWVFKPWKLQHMRRTYERIRNRLSVQLCNPRLKQITFHTFRHWKATMEYAKTKDILHVMQVLGHKNVKNTLRYTQLVNFKDDEFICKTAKTVQEASQLIEAGFEYVCDVDGVKLFRKRK